MIEPMPHIDAPEQREADVNAPQSFTPDYSIAKLSIVGIMGFIVGCIFLFYDDLGTGSKTNAVFHEVAYQPKVYAQKMVDKAIDSLRNDTIVLNSHFKKLNDSAFVDTIAKLREINSVKEKIKSDTNYINKLSVYKKYYEDFTIQDSVNFVHLNKALHFQITSYLINKWDCILNQKELLNDTCVKDKKNDSACCVQSAAEIKLDSVKCFLKDKDLPFKISAEVDVKVVKPRSDVEFITKYPNAGVWLILVLIFCSFCFTAIATSIHQKTKVAGIFSDIEKRKLSGKYYTICLTTALVMGLMAFLWDRTFYDVDIVKNLFFMQHLDVSMGCVIVLGSVAGAFCLAGFIYTASMVSYFANPFIKSAGESGILKQDLEKLKADAVFAAANQQAIAAIQQELDNKNAELIADEKKFNKLTGIFKNYFLMAAVILSLMVLCTGALFSTINSLDFVKLLADDWGYSPARSDYVYLYGGLYTIILLLIYIPAKLRFSEVDADVWAKKPQVETGPSKWYDFLKDPFGKIKDVLVATSPFLISIIQSLLDTLFK